MAASSRVIPFPERSGLSQIRAPAALHDAYGRAALIPADGTGLTGRALMACCFAGACMWVAFVGGILAVVHGPGTTPVAVYASGAVVR